MTGDSAEPSRDGVQTESTLYKTEVDSYRSESQSAYWVISLIVGFNSLPTPTTTPQVITKHRHWVILTKGDLTAVVQMKSDRRCASNPTGKDVFSPVSRGSVSFHFQKVADRTSRKTRCNEETWWTQCSGPEESTLGKPIVAIQARKATQSVKRGKFGSV